MADSIENLLKVVLDTETAMFQHYEELLPSIDNDEVREIILSIKADEEKHIANARKALEILKG